MTNNDVTVALERSLARAALIADVDHLRGALKQTWLAGRDLTAMNDETLRDLSRYLWQVARQRNSENQ